MKQLAPDLWQLRGLPANAINVYLAEDVLIDAATRRAGRRILRQVEDRTLALVALTHAHPDHQGAVQEVCEARRVPLACHADDVDTMEGHRPMGSPEHQGKLVNRMIMRYWAGPPREVERVLHEGDEVAGFRVVHAPGHAPGEVIFFRESDRVAICGDVIRNMSYATTLAGIREPPDIFTYDPAENRRSIRKLAALKPSLILPGHGPEVTDMAELDRFVAGLPD